MQEPSMTWQYQVMTWVIWSALLTRARLTVHGRENLPAGGYILASNHLSNWDPIATAIGVLHTQMHPVGKQELFDFPVLGRIPPWLGGIPVRRGSVERETIDLCRRYLGQRRPVLLLPEGTRSRTGGLSHGKPGLIFLAQLTQAPIVPVGVWGTERMGTPWRPAQVQVRFGAPIHIPRSRRGPGREAALEEVMVAIARLLPPAYRGVYAAAAQEPPTPADLPFNPQNVEHPRA